MEIRYEEAIDLEDVSVEVHLAGEGEDKQKTSARLVTRWALSVFASLDEKKVKLN